MADVEMRDAAYPQRWPGWAGAVAGYLRAPRALNPWTGQQWGWFHANRKLPIWVGGLAGEPEAWSCLQQLYALAVPVGSWVALDLETRVDRTYVTRFCAVLHWHGLKVANYGSTSTLFNNPPADGWWVADPTGQLHQYDHAGTVATQCVDAGAWDESLITDSVYNQLWL